MARRICIKPCGTLSNLGTLTVPLMGGSVQPNPPGLSISGDCPGCDFSMSLLAQVNVLLSSFGMPLCLMGCVGAIAQFSMAVQDALGPPPDPSKLITSVTNVVTKCECVLQIILPPPIGLICQFLQLVAEIVEVIAAIIECLISLVTNLVTLNVKASLLLASTNPDIQAAGQCMNDNIQGLMDLLGNQLGGLQTLWGVLAPVISLLESVVPAPFSSTIEDFMSAFQAIICGLGGGVSVSVALSLLIPFQEVVKVAAEALAVIAAICPPSSPPVC